MTSDLIKKEQPDSVIIAIGAQLIIPEIFKLDNPRIITAVQALNDLERFKNLNIVVIGGGDVGCETALCLRLKGNEVTIIEQFDELMKSDDIKHNTAVLEKMLDENGVKKLLSSEVIDVSNNIIKVRNSLNSSISSINWDVTVIAAGIKVPEEKVEKFKQRARNAYAVGDCAKCGGRLRGAINDGYLLARGI